MKHVLTCILLAVCLQATRSTTQKRPLGSIAPVQKLFIITIDGFRWQEIFDGADSLLLNDERYTGDTSTMKMMYWANSPVERRRKLLPFFWNVIGKKGQVYGNRHYSNKVNVSNLYSLSYPGYNEIFTGSADPNISSNDKMFNPNLNVLEYLDHQPAYKDHVVAFTSWDVFPYIFNRPRSGLLVNSGYERMESADEEQRMIDSVETEGVYNKGATRQDDLTFINAKEYVQKFRPAVVYLAFGETDEMAHQGKYDLYLEKATAIDRMIGELWHWVETTPGYQGQTTFIITTDHGRGRVARKWTDHGMFVAGSSQTWLALIGPNIPARGEMQNEQQLFQKQIAQTIALMLGKDFEPVQGAAPAITLR